MFPILDHITISQVSDRDATFTATNETNRTYCTHSRTNNALLTAHNQSNDQPGHHQQPEQGRNERYEIQKLSTLTPTPRQQPRRSPLPHLSGYYMGRTSQ